MKNLILILVLSLFAFACKNDKAGSETLPVKDVATNYQSFGDPITDENNTPIAELAEKYKIMSSTDTIKVKIIATIKEVCQKKGCWMTVQMGEDEVMVKFKDYAFFMPKDIAGREVIMEGKAYTEVTSVEDQRHFAEDAGESPEAIAAITETKKTYTFLSNGVLVPDPGKQ